MKKLKLVSLFLFILVIAALFTINVFATNEETMNITLKYDTSSQELITFPGWYVSDDMLWSDVIIEHSQFFEEETTQEFIFYTINDYIYVGHLYSPVNMKFNQEFILLNSDGSQVEMVDSVLPGGIYTLEQINVEIDYNKTIMINLVDDCKTFSSGLIGATWENYIDYERTNGNTNFTVLNNYVLFEGHILINKLGNPVMSSDRVIAAAGCVYTIRLLYNYNGTGYYFDEIFNNTTFYQLVGAYEDMNIHVFSLNGYYGNYYVFYNNLPLMLNDDHVNGMHYISLETYTVDNDYLCPHDYISINILQYNSCVSIGIEELKCRICGHLKTEEIPVDITKHKYQTQTYIEPTCEADGKLIRVCEYCNDTQTIIENKLGHSFVTGTCISAPLCIRCNAKGFLDVTKHSYNEATCTEPMKCRYCGNVKGEPLGHDLNIVGFCTRCNKIPKNDEPIIDYEKIIQPFIDFGSSVSKWFSDTKTDVNNFVNKIVTGIKTTAIVCGVFVVVVCIYYGLSFINNVNTFKDRWKEHRNNRKNKGNKRK